MNEVERIARQVDLTYLDGFWGGGSIRDLFRSMAASQAASYPIVGAHSAWETALHIAAWYDIFRGRIVDMSVEYRHDADWPAPGVTSADNWTATLNRLDESHKALVDAVRNLKVEDLQKVVKGREFTFYEMLHGISQHDQYHAGQVLMLKKAIAGAASK